MRVRLLSPYESIPVRQPVYYRFYEKCPEALSASEFLDRLLDLYLMAKLQRNKLLEDVKL